MGDSDVPPPLECSSNQASSSISRRRLAFRPLSVKALPRPGKTNPAEATSCSDPATSKQNNELSANNFPSANTNFDRHSFQKRRRLVTMWSFQETLIFYEGLKQHGKDFEAIAKHMCKKKINKDKEQIRNYYFNAFKIWKLKARIEEEDWIGVPRDARELFVVLNGCEWRRKTGGANFDPVKFKSLIMDGCVSVRIKKKKSLLIIRTPHCACLLKFFPYDKRNAEIPTHFFMKLMPYRYMDRNFVVFCEQNPMLALRININDKISTVFSLLERKWMPSIDKLKSINLFSKTPLIKLRVNENVQIHKVQVNVEEDNYPLMSLRKLKRDYDADEKTNNDSEQLLHISADESSNEQQRVFHSNRSTQKLSKDCNFIKIDCSSVKEVFEIDEDKLKHGLTKESVGNASILQLFYLCGMVKEISLSYEIQSPTNMDLPWEIFVSLVKRDYGEFMTKASQSLQQPSTSTTQSRIAGNETASPPSVVESAPSTTSKVDTQAVVKPVRSVSGGKKRRRTQSSAMDKTPNDSDMVPASTIVNVVEEEHVQFLEQLKVLNQKGRKPKRQVKLLHTPNKGRSTINSSSSGAFDSNHIALNYGNRLLRSVGDNKKAVQQMHGTYSVSSSEQHQIHALQTISSPSFITASPLFYQKSQNGVAQTTSSLLIGNDGITSAVPIALVPVSATVVDSAVNDNPQYSNLSSVSTTAFYVTNGPTDFSQLTTRQTMQNKPEISTSQPQLFSALTACFTSPMKTVYHVARPDTHVSTIASTQIVENATTDLSLASIGSATLGGEFSVDATTSSLSAIQYPCSGGGSAALVLEASPSKTLPDDVRTAYEQMLKESSIDYCRNFEQLTRNIDSIHDKTSLRDSSTAKHSNK